MSKDEGGRNSGTCQENCVSMSRLIRNVPMLNYLEVSPFLLLVPCIAHFRVLRFRWSAS